MILDDWFVWALLAMALGGTGYVLDIFVRGGPESVVTPWGWELVTLYMGPVHGSAPRSRQARYALGTIGADTTGGTTIDYDTL